MKENVFVKVLGVAAFRNLWLSQVVSQVFLNLLIFSLMIRVYDLTRSNAAVSLLVLLVMLPNILLGAVAGVLVDRGEKKVVMFLAHFLRVFAVLAFLLSAETLGWLYVLMLATATITQFFSPAEASMIHSVVKDKKLLMTANSLFTITFFVSVIVGNVLAGTFLRMFSDRGTFLIVAIAFLVASIFTARLPGVSIREWIKSILASGLWTKANESWETWKQTSLFSDFLVGLDHIYRSPKVQRAIYIFGASQITIGSLSAVAPGFADKILNIPTVRVSTVIMAPAALGMILGAMVLGYFSHKVMLGRISKIGVLFLAFGLVTYALVDLVASGLGIPLFVVSTILLLTLGAANSLLDVPANATIQENTPENLRSRVYGVLYTVVGLATIVPIILSGVFADIIGVRMVVLVLGVGLGLFALRFVSRINIEDKQGSS